MVAETRRTEARRSTTTAPASSPRRFDTICRARPGRRRRRRPRSRISRGGRPPARARDLENRPGVRAHRTLIVDSPPRRARSRLRDLDSPRRSPRECDARSRFEAPSSLGSLADPASIPGAESAPKRPGPLHPPGSRAQISQRERASCHPTRPPKDTSASRSGDFRAPSDASARKDRRARPPNPPRARNQFHHESRRVRTTGRGRDDADRYALSPRRP